MIMQNKKGMKKSELKKELEIAKATLELAMVALRLASEKNKKLEAKEPQAGDKIVENDNSSWFTKNDDGTYTIKLNPGIKLFEWVAKEGDSNVTGWDKPIQNDFNDQEEIDRVYYIEFKQRGKDFRHPKKETPLSDLNQEVQREQEEQEKYTKLANELVEIFMPLVNKWRFVGKVNEEEDYNGAWLYKDANKRNAAIKCAIKHCELVDLLPLEDGWVRSKEENTVLTILKKMLSE